MAEADAGTRPGPAWVTAGDALGRNRWLSHEATAGCAAFRGPVGSTELGAFGGVWFSSSSESIGYEAEIR